MFAAKRSARVLAPLAAVAAVALAGAPSHAAAPAGPSIKGKVSGIEKLIPEVYSEAAKPEAHRFTWRDPSPTVKSDFRQLSANATRDVCIAAFAGGSQGPHDPIVAKVTGGRITPSTLVVTPGTRLSFRNADPFPHSLYEVKSDKWTANATAPGSNREWMAAGPGRFEIRDTLFPSVKMVVVVDAGVLDYTFPNGEGAFQFSLPAGEYTLRVFFDGRQVGKEVAGVKADPKTPFEIKEPIAIGGDSK